MQQKPTAFVLCCFFCLYFVPIGEVAFASPGRGLDLGGAALFSNTSLPQLQTGLQAGWNVNLGLGFTLFPWTQVQTGDSYSETSNTVALIGRCQLDIFGLGASAPQSDGNLYRAWQGTGLGLLVGVASPEFQMPLLGLPARFGIEAGGGLRLTKYSGTGLVSAHPAVLGRATLDVKIVDPFAFGLFVPFEWAWKSGGRAIILGIGVSLRVL